MWLTRFRVSHFLYLLPFHLSLSVHVQGLFVTVKMVKLLSNGRKKVSGDIMWQNIFTRWGRFESWSSTLNHFDIPQNFIHTKQRLANLNTEGVRTALWLAPKRWQLFYVEYSNVAPLNILLDGSSLTFMLTSSKHVYVSSKRVGTYRYVGYIRSTQRRQFDTL